MKIFKTILWTTFFWLLVIVGLWISSYRFAEDLTIIVPSPVKNVIQGMGSVVDCECPVLEENSESTKDQVLQELEERVTTLETQHYALVQELQGIFQQILAPQQEVAPQEESITIMPENGYNQEVNMNIMPLIPNE